MTTVPGSTLARFSTNTGDRFSALAFDGTGVLYGLTGNGANLPRQLFTLDQTDGTPTPFLDLSVVIPAFEGVALAYHPEDGLLYVSTGTQLFAVDLSGPSFTAVDPCRPFSFSAQAATSLDASSLLLVNDFSELFRFDLTTTVAGSLGFLDHNSKGLAFTESLFIFTDGFESGDTSAWSNTVP